MSEWVNSGSVLTDPYLSGIINESFSKGHSLFSASTVELGTLMKSSDMDYGVLPMPIADTSVQSEYFTMSRKNYVLYALMKTSDMKELSVKAINLMGEYSERSIKPIIKELAFKNEEDKEMFELIYDGVRFDIADIFDSLFKYVDGIIVQGIKWEHSFTGMTEKTFSVSVDRLNKTLKDAVRRCENE
jgi:hypothetical protein